MSENNKPMALCRPCQQAMDLVLDEPMGRTYICPTCKTSVSLAGNRPVVEVDRVPREDVPAGTTLNGHTDRAA